MFKSAKLLIPVVALALMIAGCSSEKSPLQSDQSLLPLSSTFQLPAGATLQSASFNVWVIGGEYLSGQHVNAHRITAPWEEMTVTWNSFDSAFAPTPEGGFDATTGGFHSVDVTALVGQWLNGTYPNYGILLDQDVLEWPRTLFTTREGGIPAYLHICYELNGATVCIDEQVVMDTYIWEYWPDVNNGALAITYTGRPIESELEKWALFWFDLSVEPPELACIGDRVWYDTNCDGIQDEGELGAAGITVDLMNCAGDILATTTTDANGNYLFCDLPAGSYKIHFVLPSGYYPAPQDAGDDAMDSDADANGLTICTELVAGETDLTWDLGLCEEMETGCTRTPGYWKTHAGFGPQANVVTQYLPIWLGTPAGAKSVQVTDSALAVAILDYQYAEATASNGILKLYRNLLAAKLNLAAGASGDDLGTAVANADVFLATHNSADWAAMSKANRAQVLAWAKLFDDYNNGCIGPGHCEDDPYAVPCGAVVM